MCFVTKKILKICQIIFFCALGSDWNSVFLYRLTFPYSSWCFQTLVTCFAFYHFSYFVSLSVSLISHFSNKAIETTHTWRIYKINFLKIKFRTKKDRFAISIYFCTRRHFSVVLSLRSHSVINKKRSLFALKFFESELTISMKSVSQDLILFKITANIENIT